MLYTRKGDSGTTQLFNCPQGGRLTKHEPIFEALGTVDELNALLGLVKVHAKDKSESIACDQEKLSYEEILEKIQNILFSIQAELGGSAHTLTEVQTQYLESIVALVEKQIPPIHSFIVYGGTITSASLDVARAVARRCERLVVGVQDKNEHAVNPYTIQFLNRLSSVLFGLARHSNYSHDQNEQPPKYG